MRGATAKRVRRAARAAAGAVIRRHVESGTCPACGRAVPTFASLLLPDRDDVTFGCEHCSPPAATAIRAGRAGRAWWNLRH